MIKNIFIDMDNTIADFDNSPMLEKPQAMGSQVTPPEMYNPGFFESLRPMPGSLSGVRAILAFAKQNNIKTHILSKPVVVSSNSYSEKVVWIQKWFPELSSDIVLCQDKGLLSKKGNVLIDDYDRWRENWEINGGDFILFEQKRSSLEYWKEVISKLQALHGANQV